VPVVVGTGADLLFTTLQMKQLELQQEQEERELMERVANGEVVPTPTSASPAAGKAASGGPVRSQSGNDLASFGDNEEDKKSKYANAKSMPGSRRHSGEIKAGDAPADGQRRKGTDGQPMLNSFLFDDELDTDLQSESRSSAEAFASLGPAESRAHRISSLVRRRRLGWQVPPDEQRRRQVPRSCELSLVAFSQISAFR